MDRFLCASDHADAVYSLSHLILTAAEVSTGIQLGQIRTLRLWKLNVPKMMTLASARGHVHAQIGLAPNICSLYNKLRSNKHQVSGTN